MASVPSDTKPPRRLRPSTTIARQIAAEVSKDRKTRRVVRGRDRKFIQLFADQGYKDPDRAAQAAGFKEQYIGERLASRLSDLIQSERLRRSMDEQMELDEALRILANLARSADRHQDQHAAVRTVLQVHGALSDKPLPTGDRRTLAAQVAAVIEKIRGKGVTGTVRLRAAMETVESRQAQTQQAEVELTVQSTDDEP